MAFPANTQLELDDYEGTINANDLTTQEDESDYEGTINANEYAQSKEAEEATWWDAAKEAGWQAAAGLGQAFTWPLDVLKMAMVGEGLSDIDELEDAFRKAGKPFDRDKYIQTVMEQGEFIPTQELLERTIDKNFGTNIAEPKTRTGKFFNKLFFLGGLTRGKGLTKAVNSRNVKEAAKSLAKKAKPGVVGATTTAALREAGAPEIVSELAGDVTGGIASLEKQARKFSPESQRIIDVAEKQGLPLMEFMVEDRAYPSAKISAKRKAAFEKELGMSTEEAINRIIEEKIPIAKLGKQGQNLEILEDEAYEHATRLARENPTVLSTEELVGDIDREIARIKATSPSTSTAEDAAIRVLEKEKKKLTNPSKKGGKKSEILGPDGQPIKTESSARTPKESSVEQLIEQTRKYNSNVKGIYKKAEFSGAEDEVRQAYAFLNDRIRNTIERQAGKEVVDAHRAANSIYAQNAALARTEGMLAKAFPNGEYSAKALNKFLSTRQGQVLARDIGKDGVKEIRQIAEYGERAQKATTQYANSAKHKFNIGDWGPLAGFLLAKVPPAGAAAAAAKPIWDYVRGWTLMRPVARQAYSNIVKNAANGSFKNMAKDFAIIENEVIKEFGSVDDFIKQGVSEPRYYQEGEEGED